jgi:predicted Fe-S protein YdhL (DUF1289 family)
MDIHSPSAATPCVKICVVDPLSGRCIGCGRTIAEISLWPEMTDEQRHAVMSGLSARTAATRTRMARAGRVGSRVDRLERRPWR